MLNLQGDDLINTLEGKNEGNLPEVTRDIAELKEAMKCHRIQRKLDAVAETKLVCNILTQIYEAEHEARGE